MRSGASLRDNLPQAHRNSTTAFLLPRWTCHGSGNDGLQEIERLARTMSSGVRWLASLVQVGLPTRGVSRPAVMERDPVVSEYCLQYPRNDHEDARARTVECSADP
jgi:hypothetical protein